MDSIRSRIEIGGHVPPTKTWVAGAVKEAKLDAPTMEVVKHTGSAGLNRITIGLRSLSTSSSINRHVSTDIKNKATENSSKICNFTFSFKSVSKFLPGSLVLGAMALRSAAGDDSVKEKMINKELSMLNKEMKSLIKAFDNDPRYQFLINNPQMIANRNLSESELRLCKAIKVLDDCRYGYEVEGKQEGKKLLAEYKGKLKEAKEAQKAIDPKDKAKRMSTLGDYQNTKKKVSIALDNASFFCDDYEKLLKDPSWGKSFYLKIKSELEGISSELKSVDNDGSLEIKFKEYQEKMEEVDKYIRKNPIL